MIIGSEDMVGRGYCQVNRLKLIESVDEHIEILQDSFSILLFIKWQSRPLDDVYPIMYLDCIVVKIRQDLQVINKAIYLP